VQRVCGRFQTKLPQHTTAIVRQVAVVAQEVQVAPLALVAVLEGVVMEELEYRRA
jgi:hypothetical protein